MTFLRIVIRSIFLFEHDLFGKPLHTFPDHALADCFQPSAMPGFDSSTPGPRAKYVKPLPFAARFDMPNPLALSSMSRRRCGVLGA
jgi:hypothetical protein